MRRTQTTGVDILIRTRAGSARADLRELSRDIRTFKNDALAQFRELGQARVPAPRLGPEWERTAREAEEYARRIRRANDSVATARARGTGVVERPPRDPRPPREPRPPRDEPPPRPSTTRSVSRSAEVADAQRLQREWRAGVLTLEQYQDRLRQIAQTSTAGTERQIDALARLRAAQRQAATDAARLEAEGRARSARRLDRADAATNIVSRTGDALTVGVTAPIAVALGSATRNAVQFEAAMRNVNSIAQLSEKDFNRLYKSVLQIARDPQIVQGPRSLAQALYEIQSSGFTDTSKYKALDVLTASAKGATAGLTDTATSSNALIAVLNSGIPGITSVDGAMNTLFQTVNDGKVSFGELAGSIGAVLPTAAKAGIPIQELGGAVAALTIQGQSGAEAINDLLNLITKIANPAQESERLFRQWGISYGFVGLQAKGLPGVLEELNRATQGNADKIKLLLPDMQAQRAALGLLKNDVSDYNRFVGNQAKANQDVGATQRALNEQTKSLQFQLSKLSQEWEVLSAEVGPAFIRAIRDGLQAVRPFLNMVRELAVAFAKLPPEQQQTIIKWLALLALVGPLLSGFGRIAGGLVDMIRLFRDLAPAAGAAGTTLATTTAGGMTAAGAAAAGASTRVGALTSLLRGLMRIGRVAVTIAIAVAGAELLTDLVNAIDKLTGNHVSGGLADLAEALGADPAVVARMRKEGLAGPLAAGREAYGATRETVEANRRNREAENTAVQRRLAAQERERTFERIAGLPGTNRTGADASAIYREFERRGREIPRDLRGQQDLRQAARQAAQWAAAEVRAANADIRRLVQERRNTEAGKGGLAIAEAALRKQLSGHADDFKGYCQKLVRETVQSVTPAFNRYWAGSASETMRNFQRAGIGQAYKPGMRLLPGDLLYGRGSGSGDGHASIVGPDGRILDDRGAGGPTGFRTPQWVVRPGDVPTTTGRAGAGRGTGAAAGGRIGGRRYTGRQLEIARRIVAIGREVGASDREILSAMEAGLVESNLQNMAGGDRDSRGVMQQRPSQGWGSPAQVTNVDYAIRTFFLGSDRGNPGLLDIRNRTAGLTPGRAAQAVQRSAFPERYDQREAEARALIAAVDGGGTGTVFGGRRTGGGPVQPSLTKDDLRNRARPRVRRAEVSEVPAEEAGNIVRDVTARYGLALQRYEAGAGTLAGARRTEAERGLMALANQIRRAEEAVAAAKLRQARDAAGQQRAEAERLREMAQNDDDRERAEAMITAANNAEALAAVRNQGEMAGIRRDHSDRYRAITKQTEEAQRRITEEEARDLEARHEEGERRHSARVAEIDDTLQTEKDSNRRALLLAERFDEAQRAATERYRAASAAAQSLPTAGERRRALTAAEAAFTAETAGIERERQRAGLENEEKRLEAEIALHRLQAENLDDLVARHRALNEVRAEEIRLLERQGTPEAMIGARRDENARASRAEEAEIAMHNAEALLVRAATEGVASFAPTPTRDFWDDGATVLRTQLRTAFEDAARNTPAAERGRLANEQFAVLVRAVESGAVGLNDVLPLLRDIETRVNSAGSLDATAGFARAFGTFFDEQLRDRFDDLDRLRGDERTAGYTALAEGVRSGEQFASLSQRQREIVLRVVNERRDRREDGPERGDGVERGGMRRIARDFGDELNRAAESRAPEVLMGIFGNRGRARNAARDFWQEVAETGRRSLARATNELLLRPVARRIENGLQRALERGAERLGGSLEKSLDGFDKVFKNGVAGILQAAVYLNGVLALAGQGGGRKGKTGGILGAIAGVGIGLATGGTGFALLGAGLTGASAGSQLAQGNYLGAAVSVGSAFAPGGAFARPGGAPVPGRALGGPVARGFRYIGGEGGPEPFIPSRDGLVLPSAFALSRLPTVAAANNALLGQLIDLAVARGGAGGGDQFTMIDNGDKYYPEDANRAMRQFVREIRDGTNRRG